MREGGWPRRHHRSLPATSTWRGSASSCQSRRQTWRSGHSWRSSRCTAATAAKPPPTARLSLPSMRCKLRHRRRRRRCSLRRRARLCSGTARRRCGGSATCSSCCLLCSACSRRSRRTARRSPTSCTTGGTIRCSRCAWRSPRARCRRASPRRVGRRAGRDEGGERAHGLGEGWPRGLAARAVAARAVAAEGYRPRGDDGRRPPSAGLQCDAPPPHLLWRGCGAHAHLVLHHRRGRSHAADAHVLARRARLRAAGPAASARRGPTIPTVPAVESGAGQ
mmetsp:Transcript_40439/g.131347  ORF Transcript_40439/g.131347 Transcript_40439/m.131347 type:complete len:278 (-) Transcript_40439:97-930(-)